MKETGRPLLKWRKASDANQNGQASGPQLPPEPEATSGGVWEVIKILCLAAYRLRSVFLAIPVIFGALQLAAYNSEHLPALVGLNMQTTGEFAQTISRSTAVTMPLFLTGGCIVLMFFSRKPIYPWLISIFTLAVPVLLLVTNTVLG